MTSSHATVDAPFPRGDTCVEDGESGDRLKGDKAGSGQLPGIVTGIEPVGGRVRHGG